MSSPSEDVQSIVCTCPIGFGRIAAAIGWESGSVTLVARSLDQLASFDAHTRIIDVTWAGGKRGCLVSLGHEESSKEASQSVRLWCLDTVENGESSFPNCLRFVRLFPTTPRAGELPTTPTEATCASACTDGQMGVSLAVGLHDGTAMIVRSELTREKVSRSKVGPVDGEDEDSWPVTAVAWRKETGHEYLFVTSERTIACYDVDGGGVRTLFDKPGSREKCTALTEKGELAVARSEAVYFYEADDRGPALAFAGDKRLVASMKGHLITVTETQQRSELAKFHVYDCTHKVIAFESDAGGVKFMLCLPGWCLALQSDGIGFVLRCAPLLLMVFSFGKNSSFHFVPFLPPGRMIRRRRSTC